MLSSAREREKRDCWLGEKETVHLHRHRYDGEVFEY